MAAPMGEFEWISGADPIRIRMFVQSWSASTGSAEDLVHTQTHTHRRIWGGCARSE